MYGDVCICVYACMYVCVFLHVSGVAEHSPMRPLVCAGYFSSETSSPAEKETEELDGAVLSVFGITGDTKGCCRKICHGGAVEAAR